jgi:hypothetical protein
MSVCKQYLGMRTEGPPLQTDSDSWRSHDAVPVTWYIPVITCDKTLISPPGANDCVAINDAEYKAKRIDGHAMSPAFATCNKKAVSFTNISMLQLSLFFGIVARFVWSQDVAGVGFAFFCVLKMKRSWRSPFLYVSDLINLKGEYKGVVVTRGVIGFKLDYVGMHQLFREECNFSLSCNWNSILRGLKLLAEDTHTQWRVGLVCVRVRGSHTRLQAVNFSVCVRVVITQPHTRTQ